MESLAIREKKFNRAITAISILIPLVVALLFGIKIPGAEPLGFLPPIYASINGLTAFLLVMAVWAIKKRRVRVHRNLMTICIALSVVFLLMYIAYHMTSNPTPYGGGSPFNYVYYFVLITHIVLSVLLIPLVLKTYVRANLRKFESHRKLARITFPVWLYVTVSGVIIYLMISPYYV